MEMGDLRAMCTSPSHRRPVETHCSKSNRRCRIMPSGAIVLIIAFLPAVVNCFSALPCEIHHNGGAKSCSFKSVALRVHRGTARTHGMDSSQNVPLQERRVQHRRIQPAIVEDRAILEDSFSDSSDGTCVSEDSDADVSGDDADRHIDSLQSNWEFWMNRNFPDVVSAMEDLTHKSASVRKAAVSQLLKSAGPINGPLDGHQVRAITTALAGRLGDDSASVREAAVKGLSCINGKGNRNLILAMAELAEEETAVTVRRAAIQALTRIADRGDGEALAPVLRVLHRVEGHERGDHFTPHLSPKLSRHAVRAVGSLAGRGDQAALQALCARVADDADGSVREAAARSLGSVADVRDRCAVAALALGLEDRDEAVRRAAHRSLRAVIRAAAEGGDGTGAEGPAPEEPWRAARLWLLPEVCDC